MKFLFLPQATSGHRPAQSSCFGYHFVKAKSENTEGLLFLAKLCVKPPSHWEASGPGRTCSMGSFIKPCFGATPEQSQWPPPPGCPPGGFAGLPTGLSAGVVTGAPPQGVGRESDCTCPGERQEPCHAVVQGHHTSEARPGVRQGGSLGPVL